MELVKQRYEVVPIDSIEVHPDNPRRGNTDAIGASIEANGFYGSVVVQESTRRIIAGAHRFLTAAEAGAEEVPVIFVDVDDETAVRMMLVDNRTSDLAGYDDESLATLLNSVDLDGTGWEEQDLEALVKRIAPVPPAAIPSYEGASKETHTCPSCGFRWEAKGE